MSSDRWSAGLDRAGMARALARWQRGAGPYWPYVCAAPFLGDVAPASRAAGKPRLLSTLTNALAGVGDGGLAVFVDLSPAQSLPLAPRIRTLGFYVVPVIQRWPAAPAVLRCERLMADLLDYAPAPPWPELCRGVVLLLDGDRLGELKALRESPGPGARSPSPRRFDNRYSYPLCRFPPSIFLRAQGITRVRWLSSAGIAPDLEPYAQRLAEAGLTPQLIDRVDDAPAGR